MNKYEYTSVVFSKDRHIVDKLNEWGDDGWQVVGLVKTDLTTTVIFMREKPTGA